MALIHFLLTYDLGTRRLVDEQQFASADDAADAYAEAEDAHRGDDTIETVLVGADSRDTVRQTHSHYFDGPSSESRFLTGVRSPS